MRRRTREIELLDLCLHGRARSTAAFLIRGRSNVLVETGPGSTLPQLLEQLDRAVDRLDWIVVTHIHLDHAGALGALAARFPEARIGVHPLGARHLIDPSRLWASAQRVYGAQTERLWGGMEPVAAERIVTLDDRARIELDDGCLSVLHTPGHARHHLSLLDETSGSLFAGDAIGIQHPASPVIRPTVPPPDFDLGLALASIERIAGLAPTALWLTHFGAAHGRAVGVCEQASEALRRWCGLVERLGAEGLDDARLLRAVTRQVDAWEAPIPPAARATIEGTNSIALNVAGIQLHLSRAAAA